MRDAQERDSPLSARTARRSLSAPGTTDSGRITEACSRGGRNWHAENVPSIGSRSRRRATCPQDQGVDRDIIYSQGHPIDCWSCGWDQCWSDGIVGEREGYEDRFFIHCSIPRECASCDGTGMILKEFENTECLFGGSKASTDEPCQVCWGAGFRTRESGHLVPMCDPFADFENLPLRVGWPQNRSSGRSRR